MPRKWGISQTQKEVNITMGPLSFSTKRDIKTKVQQFTTKSEGNPTHPTYTHTEKKKNRVKKKIITEIWLTYQHILNREGQRKKHTEASKQKTQIWYSPKQHRQKEQPKDVENLLAREKHEKKRREGERREICNRKEKQINWWQFFHTCNNGSCKVWRIGNEMCHLQLLDPNMLLLLGSKMQLLLCKGKGKRDGSYSGVWYSGIAWMNKPGWKN